MKNTFVAPALSEVGAELCFPACSAGTAGRLLLSHPQLRSKVLLVADHMFVCAPLSSSSLPLHLILFPSPSPSLTSSPPPSIHLIISSLHLLLSSLLLHLFTSSLHLSISTSLHFSTSSSLHLSSTLHLIVSSLHLSSPLLLLQRSSGSELLEVMRRRQEKLASSTSDSGVESFDEGCSH